MSSPAETSAPLTGTLTRTRVSVELVPRDLAGLQAELETIRSHLSGVDTVNVPDLTRFKLRSWHGCAAARAHVQRAIPHIRAIDIDPRRPLPMAEELLTNGITEVLIVTGDAPADMSRRVYETSSLEIIRKFARELPEVKVYAALDPYRQGFTRERDYAQAKLEAGASGFFTQPFFDLRLMDLYADLLEPDAEVFWGVTTVTTARTLSYWQARNKAIFPRSFTPTLDWSREMARAALHFARERGQHVYFMPVRADLKAYLEGIV